MTLCSARCIPRRTHTFRCSNGDEILPCSHPERCTSDIWPLLVPRRQEILRIAPTRAGLSQLGRCSSLLGADPRIPKHQRMPRSRGDWSRVLLFAGVLAQDHLKGLLKIQNRYFRGDGGIGAAPRLAAAHRAADTNAPGGHLNHTPGEGACVSHVAACAVLRPPAPSEARLIGLQRERTGRQAPEHPVATSHRPSARWPAPHLVHLAACGRACSFHKPRLFSSTLPRRAPASAGGVAGTSSTSLTP